MGKRGKKRRAKKTRGGRKPVLSDHRRQGKKLVPPFLAALGGKFEPAGWRDQLIPELLWIHLLIDRLGLRRAVQYSSELVKAAVAAEPDSPVPYVRVSDYASLGPESWQSVLSLTSDEAIAGLRHALWPLVGMYPECPLHQLVDEAWRSEHRCDPEAEIPYLKRAIREIVSKDSEKATQLMATAVCLWGQSGRLKFVAPVEPPDLDGAVRDPTSPEGLKAAASLRAMINMLGSLAIPPACDWIGYFWRQGLRTSACELPAIDDSASKERPELTGVLRAGESFAPRLARELAQVWERNVVAACAGGAQRSEVLGGLMARQANLAMSLAGSPSTWDADIASILLRSMAETHIALAWLAEFGQPEHFEAFVEYGLGQEKLLLEHLKTDMEDASASQQKALSLAEEMINQERYTQLLTVDLGQWLPKTTLKMAEDCECLDIYFLKFQPLSGNVHGTWNILKRYHLLACANPLHGFHRVPQFEYRIADAHVAAAAVRLLDETFSCWAQGMKLRAGGLASCRDYLHAVRRCNRSQA